MLKTQLHDTHDQIDKNDVRMYEDLLDFKSGNNEELEGFGKRIDIVRQKGNEIEHYVDIMERRNEKKVATI